MELWGGEWKVLMRFPLVRPSVLALVLALNLGFAGDAASFTSVEFQPLEPGDSWTFLEDNVFTEIETVLPGTQLVNGVPTRVIEISGGPDDGSRVFITNDTNGLRLHKETEPDPMGGVLVFSPPLTFLPAIFEIGTTFSGAGSAEFTFTGLGTFPGSYSFSSEVVGVEQVVVPAGTFQALQLDTTFSFSITVSGVTTVVNGTGSDWGVRNLGAVLSIGTMDGDPFISELVSTNLELCGDVADDGFVGPEDVALFRDVLAGLAAFTLAGEAKCTVIDRPSDCGLVHLTVIRREIEGALLEPGISQVCGAAMGVPCVHEKCIAGEPLDPICDPCVGQICATDSLCCEVFWDSVCVGEVASICGEQCGGDIPCNHDDDLTPCDQGVFDRWEFNVAAGDTVTIRVDTKDANTAADLFFSGVCGAFGFSGDDEFACTFPPPAFACPETRFVAAAAGTCTVDVQSFPTCTDVSTANYCLGVEVDPLDSGPMDAEPILTMDNVLP